MTDHPVTQQHLDQVLADHPQLTDHGLPHTWPDITPDKSRETLRNRLDEVQAAYTWLGGLRRTAISKDSPTSYGLKHVAEPEIGYTSNGAFIAAAILHDIRMKVYRDSPNPLLGVTTEPARRRAPAGSFTAWLRKRTKDDDPVGDLARDADADHDWPVSGGFEVYHEYLTRVGASYTAVEVLFDAWEAYSGHRPADLDEDE